RAAGDAGQCGVDVRPVGEAIGAVSQDHGKRPLSFALDQWAGAHSGRKFACWPVTGRILPSAIDWMTIAESASAPLWKMRCVPSGDQSGNALRAWLSVSGWRESPAGSMRYTVTASEPGTIT